MTVRRIAVLGLPLLLTATGLTLLLTLALTALSRRLAMLLTAALTAITPLVALTFAGLSARVELFLQVAESLIAKPLLFAQGLGEPLHRLLGRGFRHDLALPCALRACAGSRSNSCSSRNRLFGFGHAPLLHKFLDPVHHALDVVLRHLHLHGTGLAAEFCGFSSLSSRHPTGPDATIAEDSRRSRVSVLRIKPFDFGLTGPLAHRLVEAFLRLRRRRSNAPASEITLFDDQGQIPKVSRPDHPAVHPSIP